jgi:Zn ribbon nucleic-acid-binding protein
MASVDGRRIPDKVHVCATCGVKKKTSAVSEVWYCKEHRICAQPDCTNTVYVNNATCSECHSKRKFSTAYSKNKVITMECEQCGHRNKYIEYQAVREADSLRCMRCRDYLTDEIRERQKQISVSKVRHCIWCHAKLSVYNRGKVCNPCWTKAPMHERYRGKWSSESARTVV